MKRIALVIVLKIVELIGAVGAVIVLPLVFGAVCNNLFGWGLATGDWFRCWIGGLSILVIGLAGLGSIYFVVIRGIPALVKQNLRWADRMLNKNEEIYCDACSKAGGARMPIYHLPPECEM